MAGPDQLAYMVPTLLFYLAAGTFLYLLFPDTKLSVFGIKLKRIA